MKQVVILLKQHVGALCEAIVKVGDQVKRGQLIAKPVGLGANIHASVSGSVAEVADDRIILDYEPAEFDPEYYEPLEASLPALAKIEQAGIVGAGGAGFPTHIKLAKPLPGGYVIANAAECEPLLEHNIHFIEESAEVLIRGLHYLLDITQASSAYVAIKAKHRQAVASLYKAIRKLESPVQVKILTDMYPAGDERVIIRELLDITLAPGQLPIEANAVVSNVETIKRMVEAIEDNKPFIDKDVTVAGSVKEHSRVFFDIPIGTELGELIAEAGGMAKQHGEIVVGGPFTGRSASPETPITKTTGGVLVALPFPQEKRKIGLICCECGAQEQRLREVAEAMGGNVVAAQRCKRMVEVGGRYRCELPGICPGQAQTVFALKKQGAEVILTGTCQD